MWQFISPGDLYRSPQYILYGMANGLSRITAINQQIAAADKLSQWLEKATEEPALSVTSAIA